MESRAGRAVPAGSYGSNLSPRNGRGMADPLNITPSFSIGLEGAKLRVCALSSKPILLVTGEPGPETSAALRALADLVDAVLASASPQVANAAEADAQGSLL